MQTYTHSVIGAAIGAVAYHDPVLALVCAASAATPDLSMAPSYMYDKMRGKVPLAEQSGLLMFVKNVSHSAILWLGITLVGFFVHPLLFVAGIGGVSHVATDLFTHGSSKFNRYDCLYFWPVQTEPWNVGSWDYRIAVGQLWPVKWIEFVTIVVGSGITGLYLL